MSNRELWQQAKSLIPGGNQLLSKRPEMYLPGLWPTYFKKAEGCRVWDLDGNEYLDFAQMGVGSCSLGYADPDVNRAVSNAIARGSMATLNSFEEVELAERLTALHPWSDMARFARTGGEACAVAVRIARAASGRSKVAFCGYHGWHDWYLSANVAHGANLDEQLLPGLKPLGVSPELGGTAIPFGYNRSDELERIVADHPGEIGVIFMEPQRSEPPQDGFLARVRKIADAAEAVLVFDEITSGFRMNFGGIHLLHGVEPDIAVFGKALGNGFPISAIIGRREFMDSAQDTFISSTFWTERIGFTAALATLEKMEQLDLPKHLVRHGEAINEGWRTLSERHGIPIAISGIPPLTHIQFLVDQPLVLQTLYTQEMLARGYLLGAAVYTTYAYSDRIIQQFIEDSDRVFQTLKNALDSSKPSTFLKGECRHAGFKRLA